MNLEAMRQARDEVAELTATALEIQAGAIDAATPEGMGADHRIASSYLNLARAAVERFEEAANGA